MQQWLSKIDIQKLNRLAPILFFLILVWLCWRLANLFWWFVAPPQVPVIQPVVLGSQQPVMPNIVQFSLFEEKGEAPQAQTNLPLKLEGVMLASPHYLSSAVIRVNNEVDSYRIGEQLGETGSKLEDVSWDRIVIRESGGQVREIKFADSTTTANQSADTNMEEPMAQPSNTTPAKNDAKAGINQAIDQLQQNREQYLDKMGVNEGGNGFEITNNTPPALRARLGLKPGDRVVSVNGQNIGAGTNEAQLLEQIKKTGQAKIEIQRGDQTMTIQQSF